MDNPPRLHPVAVWFEDHDLAHLGCLSHLVRMDLSALIAHLALTACGQVTIQRQVADQVLEVTFLPSPVSLRVDRSLPPEGELDDDW